VAWGWRQNLLNADRVPPGHGEVVRVDEARARAEAEIGQAHLVGVVGEAHPTKLDAAVALAVDADAGPVGFGPTADGLDVGVEVGDGGRAGDQQAAPAAWTAGITPDAELIDNRGIAGGHAAPHSTQAVGQGAVDVDSTGGLEYCLAVSMHHRSGFGSV